MGEAGSEPPCGLAPVKPLTSATPTGDAGRGRGRQTMGAVTPFLWFDASAEEAITFYTALIPGSEIVQLSRYPAEVPGMGGMVMPAHFRLGGRDYYAMDAGPEFPF